MLNNALRPEPTKSAPKKTMGAGVGREIARRTWTRMDVGVAFGDVTEGELRGRRTRGEA